MRGAGTADAPLKTSPARHPLGSAAGASQPIAPHPSRQEGMTAKTNPRRTDPVGWLLTLAIVAICFGLAWATGGHDWTRVDAQADLYPDRASCERIWPGRCTPYDREGRYLGPYYQGASYRPDGSVSAPPSRSEGRIGTVVSRGGHGCHRPARGGRVYGDASFCRTL